MYKSAEDHYIFCFNNAWPGSVLFGPAFCYCQGLVFVEVPEGYQVIEQELFSCCQSLTTVKIPSSVINIRDGAFSDCLRLSSLDIPHGLVEIGRWAFQSCEFETIHIHHSTVTTIGEGAFEGCKRLKCTELPPTLEIIEETLFHGCHKLEYIEIPTTGEKDWSQGFLPLQVPDKCTSPTECRVHCTYCFFILYRSLLQATVVKRVNGWAWTGGNQIASGGRQCAGT
eukprot:scaffold15821_cov70-Cylindrotheca_fusiformis.AAC.1